MAPGPLKKRKITLLLCAGIMCLLSCILSVKKIPGDSDPDAKDIPGDVIKWHILTIDFHGPATDEKASDPNPFLDYRLRVLFIGPSGQAYNVPGFYDGNGNGHGEGDIWRVRFRPDEAGAWSYLASFREGSGVAIDLNPGSGTAAFFDGHTGSFSVSEPKTPPPGFLRHGFLEYAGGYYLKFREGPYWIKGGTDSPENFLGYSGFDNTPAASLDFSSHISDWRTGDPDWNRQDPSGTENGRAIIGALNYLSSKHVNSIYFLPMNTGGDAKDTWPYIGPINPEGSASNDNLHFDISKLTQWEIVFNHAQEKGIFLHFVLNEAEAPNKNELDQATLGVERKLFYRELVARFGHHLALQWNLCEEYNLDLPIPAGTIKEFAGYLKAIDPYRHPVTVHQSFNPRETWAPFLGDDRFSITSLQYYQKADGLGAEVEWFRDQSALAGYPIPVMIDEPESIMRLATLDDLRKRMLWDILLSGGGVEWIKGTGGSADNFREVEQVWEDTWFARKFIEENLPFHEMEPLDSLVSGASTLHGGPQVFLKSGEKYAIYFPSASATGNIDLSSAKGDFRLRWYNPRTGEFQGNTKTLAGGSEAVIGSPPESPSEDWVALFEKL